MPSIEDRLAPYELELLRIYFALFATGLVLVLGPLRQRIRIARENWDAIILRVSSRPWMLTDAALIIVLILALNFGYGWWMGDRLAVGDFSTLVAGMVLLHGVILVSVAVILFMRRLRIRDAFGSAGHRLAQDIGLGCTGFVAMYVIMLPAMFLSGLILNWLGRPEKYQDVVNIFAMQDTLTKQTIFAAGTVFVAPLAEELLFRGILLPLALRKFSSTVAVLLVSLVFAAIHLNDSVFLQLFAVSIALSLAYIATESIVVSIVMHMLFNALTVAILFFAT